MSCRRRFGIGSGSDDIERRALNSMIDWILEVMCEMIFPHIRFRFFGPSDPDCPPQITAASSMCGVRPKHGALNSLHYL